IIKQSLYLSLAMVKSFFWILVNIKKILAKRKVIQKFIRRRTDSEVMQFMIKKSVVILFFLKGYRTFLQLKNVM
ncbi:MAG: hypothetical protein J7L47_07345, partial [Candidatus Odinarchaeota archaeon]|nr:hypothetical protein [Candidatus Odinarchaeota archaeon]